VEGAGKSLVILKPIVDHTSADPGRRRASANIAGCGKVEKKDCLLLVAKQGPPRRHLDQLAPLLAQIVNIRSTPPKVEY
jgi:hypothetical protein